MKMVEAIKAYFPRYPTRQAVTLPALHIVNERCGCVPIAAVVEIAELLDLAPAEVQDTLSFYGFFKQDAPHGRTGLGCAARSVVPCAAAKKLLDHMCQQLGIKPGETTADGRLTLEFGECLGACDFAPCMLAGETLHKDLTPAKADEILKTFE